MNLVHYLLIERTLNYATTWRVIDVIEIYKDIEIFIFVELVQIRVEILPVLTSIDTTKLHSVYV